MAKRALVFSPDELLRKRSREVTSFDARLATLLDDMAETMYAADGVGLAAVQVGVLRRAVVIDCGEKRYELINPEILETSGEQTGAEGCLSFPDQYGEVTRPNYVKVRAQDRRGNWYEAEGEGLLARAFCHEIDHLDGHLFSELTDRLYTNEELDELMEAEGEEQA